MTSIQLPDHHVLDANLFSDERAMVGWLVANMPISEAEKALVHGRAVQLANAVRQNRKAGGTIDAFLQEYALSSEEGVVLMCLAEALLRIPDSATADKLIADKLGGKKWKEHLGKSSSLFVNASTWGLMLTGKLLTLSRSREEGLMGAFQRLTSQSSEPIIRAGLRQAMRIMGGQFVLGRTIKEALSVSEQYKKNGYSFSYDMLGEAAMTRADAERYFSVYMSAAQAIGKVDTSRAMHERPSLSIKLSALHPRFEERQREDVLKALVPRVKELALHARASGIGLTIDAEEAARLALQLDVFAEVLTDPDLKGWNGLGLAVQAYGRRAHATLEWLAAVARSAGAMIPVRLVKGAYWDAEIKRAQEGGLASYPVFTSKPATDLNYLSCAKYMLGHPDLFYPQFATHNAQTLAEISVLGRQGQTYEFQRLHGMGEQLYDAMLADPALSRRVRIYAPVGSHEDLLSYLVRRLLENGANTSFVNRLADDEAPLDDVIADPRDVCSSLVSKQKPNLPEPSDIFGGRRNSAGLVFWQASERARVVQSLKPALSRISGLYNGKASHDIRSPHDRRVLVGKVDFSTPDHAAATMARAKSSQKAWNALGGEQRAIILEQAAVLFEQSHDVFVALLVREAGKTLETAWAEIREAVDFLRYYALLARTQFSAPRQLPGPTGEDNELSLHGRGVFVCISPWNFPLAIFTGQIAAALAAGNSVVAKPAEQTPLIALEAGKLLHAAGVPAEVLAVLPGDGAGLGPTLLGHPALSGVAFTGSNETASIINRKLAERAGAILPLIAETGGINAMIADSSALPEQVVRDLVASAFDSAGQRCSAARILYIQRDNADRVLALLKGAAEELVIGDPLEFSTDVGPVIDAEAQAKLEAHKVAMRKRGKVLFDLPLPASCHEGTFVAPAAYELESLQPLQSEVFGPILHVVRFDADKLDKVVDAINGTGFGLTCAVHTRIGTVAEELKSKISVGNLYINRNQIGAVVESQPFGGEGLSGTGPKAGGPHYLTRFSCERVTSTDTTAAGGNAALMTFGSEGE
jgi:RHH-type transcriptional regulator, proline utilization regulon repressor / proline dehydrogenase / delta 1-pyrroline-5-carboxylate dehydrogenase